MTPTIPETYSFVLQRFNVDTGHLSPRIRFCAGNVNIQSHKAQSMHPKAKKGELAHTLFFPETRPFTHGRTEAAKNRAIMTRGWHEVTDEWNRKDELKVVEDPVATPPEAVARGLVADTREVVVREGAITSLKDVEEMPWQDLRSYAISLGLKAKGARADIESAILKALGLG